MLPLDALCASMKMFLGLVVNVVGSDLVSVPLYVLCVRHCSPLTHVRRVYATANAREWKFDQYLKKIIFINLQ